VINNKKPQNYTYSDVNQSYKKSKTSSTNSLFIKNQQETQLTKKNTRSFQQSILEVFNPNLQSLLSVNAERTPFYLYGWDDDGG